MPLFGRIRDAVKAAWNVIWGRSEVQIRMARIEREWMQVEVEVSAMFDNVNALLARLAKRKRVQDKDESALGVAATPQLVNDKAALRSRVAAAKGGRRGAHRARVESPEQEKVS